VTGTLNVLLHGGLQFIMLFDAYVIVEGVSQKITASCAILSVVEMA